MEPKSRDIIELEEALRKDIRAMLEEDCPDLDDAQLEKLEARIMNRAAMQMCQRTEDPLSKS